jgi:superfamily I DNA/RNA helicase
MADTPFRTSPSAIARYFFHDCERFLRYLATGPELQRREGIPQREFDHSPLVKALLESGYAWEQTVLHEHLAGRVRIAGGAGPDPTRRFDWAQTLELLQSAEPGAYIYQPTLHLPPAFYRRFDIDPALVTISDNHPDLIAVLPGAGGMRRLRLIDLKRGESLQLTHRVQVLLYALELDSILEAQPFADLAVDLELGGVWLGGQAAPTEFSLGDFRPHLENFLRRDLLRVLRTGAHAARWHVRYRCEWCEFFRHCWSEMQRSDDLSRVAQLTPWGKQFLRERASVRTTAELSQFLQRPDADETLSRCASLAGRGPRLSRQVAALEQGAPQSYGAASPSLSRGENVGLILTLAQEPLGESIYVAGLYVTVRRDLRQAVFSAEVQDQLFSGAKSRPFVLVADRPAAVGDIRRQWVHLLHAVISQVHQYNVGRDWSEQLSLQAYVLSEQERVLLVSWLLDSLRDPELAAEAMTLLFHFQAPELLAANEHPDREVPFPLVVLLDALGQVLALPVEVSYTLPESLQSLNSRFQLRRNDYFHFPLGPGLRAEPIHAAWYRGKTEMTAQIAEQAVMRLHAMWALLQSLRHHAQDSLFSWSAKFTLPARQEFADPLLSRLAFFARYESLLRCLETRRVRCEPRPVQLLTGNALELEAQTAERFTIVGGALELEPTGFPEWLLVTDSEAGRRAQLEYRDYASRAQLWQGRKQADLAVVGVSEVQRDALGTPHAVTVQYVRPFDGEPPQPGQRLLLHPRFTDFTTDGVVEFLRAGGAAQHGLFLRLLRDPAAAAEPVPLPEAVQSHVAAAAGAFPWTDSQADAFRQVCRRRSVPVWGPPGTGKTHFLAATVLTLADAHARAGQPFRVLVTAFTHAAIENLLRQIVKLRDARLPQSQTAIGKAKDWQGPENQAVEVVFESNLSAWLTDHPQAIVGATVYSTLKKCGELPRFDLVVIDEASQVRVPEAAVPIGLVAPQGRLVLAGDHLQLPPIVVGAYPDPPPDEPVLHRSIFEAVRGPDSRSGEDGLQNRPPAEEDGLESHPTAGDDGLEHRPAKSSDDVRNGRAGLPILRQLTENFRMNDVLTSFAAGLLYGPDYHSFDDTVARRRLNLVPERGLDPFVEACLDPEFPLVFVVLDGVWAARENPLEAQLAAKLVAALRGTLRRDDGKLFADDAAFFREGVFMVSPHRAQIHAIRRELRRQRMWQSPPLVDTVDKIQGQEADAVVVSYGVADPEFAAEEAEFIYGLNRLNVAITRARSKCVVCLPRPLLEAPPQVLDLPEAARGLAYMRALVEAVSQAGDQLAFELDDGASATVYRARHCFPARGSGRISSAVQEPSLPVAPPAPAARTPPPATLYPPAEAEVAWVAAEGQDAHHRADAPHRAPVRRGRKSTAHQEPPSMPKCPPQTHPVLSRLNEPQREAAGFPGDDPLLIIAGAGTGKTTTLVHRVAWLISQGIAPHHILLLTFTRRAAGEMLRRVADVLAQADIDRKVWGGTFHGIGTRLLRMYGPALGLDQRFTIHDQSDAEDLMGVLCQELKLGKSDKGFPKKRTCLAMHSYSVNAELPLADVLATQYRQQRKYAEPLQQLFEAYCRRKAELNVMDYDDLLLRWCDLLDHEEAGRVIRGRFDCVLVDEYQDTNRLQSRLLQGLRPDGRGLTVVGDDAQSIYSFRAATVRNILDFPKQFPGAQVIKLEQNYRSTQLILHATNRVMADSRQGFAKELWSERAGGPRPQLIACYDEREQAEFVVGRILEHRHQGLPLAQQAVLFRASHHSIALEAELARHDIPFAKYGGLKFVEAAHVKDLLSLVRLAENPRDIVSGQRALCLLPGIGPKKAGDLLGELHAAGERFEAWQEVSIPAKSKEMWPAFVKLLRSLASDDKHEELGRQVHRAIKFYEPLLQEHYDNAAQRLADLEQLEQLAGSFPDRAALLADLAIDPPQSTADFPQDAPPEDRLVLSTMHSAKGLEWRAVYVLHATEGKMPLEHSLWDPDQVEEERRLFYVALTRAADWLYVCHPQHEAASYGKGGSLWGGSVYERCELTRFVGKSVRTAFQHQDASTFEPPEHAGSVPEPKQKTRRGSKTGRSRVR